MKEENTYNEILVVSVGATPQVVTETLWYYTYNKIRKFDRIVLITTSTGKEKIIEELLGNGWLNKLEKALSIEKDTFVINPEEIVAISDNDGNALEDIRTSKDCEDMMTHVFRIMRQLTDDVDSRLTIVVAGGRKTMPATLALASSIYGRKQDEMVHVLINDELFWTDWFFPTDPNDPKQQIELSQIPFLKMNKFLSGIDVENPLAAVELTQTRLDDLAHLTKVDIDGSRIIVDGEKYKLPPAEMQIWRYLARKKIDQCVRSDLELCGPCTDCYATHSELIDEFDGKIADEYFKSTSEGSDAWEKRKIAMKERGLYDKDTRVRELKSKIKKNIRKIATDPRLYHQIQLVDEPNSDDLSKFSCGIRADKGAIEFLDDNVAKKSNNRE